MPNIYILLYEADYAGDSIVGVFYERAVAEQELESRNFGRCIKHYSLVEYKALWDGTMEEV
jgi:hypothetical protein